MKFISRAMILLGLLAGITFTGKADVIWTLQDVTFSNGNAATGSFTTDNAITTVESFSISVTGPATSAAFVAAQMVDAYLPGAIGIANASFSEYVDLTLSSNLTSAGGIIPIVSGFDCPGCGTLIVNPDTAVVGPTAAAPEPGALGLLAAGATFTGVVLRRKLAV